MNSEAVGAQRANEYEVQNKYFNVKDSFLGLVVGTSQPSPANYSSLILYIFLSIINNTFCIFDNSVAADYSKNRIEEEILPISE
jgi:hypothetical protein